MRKQQSTLLIVLSLGALSLSFLPSARPEVGRSGNRYRSRRALSRRTRRTEPIHWALAGSHERSQRVWLDKPARKCIKSDTNFPVPSLEGTLFSLPRKASITWLEGEASQVAASLPRYLLFCSLVI